MTLSPSASYLDGMTNAEAAAGSAPTLTFSWDFGCKKKKGFRTGDLETMNNNSVVLGFVTAGVHERRSTDSHSRPPADDARQSRS